MSSDFFFLAFLQRSRICPKSEGRQWEKARAGKSRAHAKLVFYLNPVCWVSQYRWHGLKTDENTEEGRRTPRKKSDIEILSTFSNMLDSWGGDVASADESRSFPDATRKSSKVNQYISICDVHHLLIHRSLLLIYIKYDVRISMQKVWYLTIRTQHHNHKQSRKVRWNLGIESADVLQLDLFRRGTYSEYLC